MNIYDELLDKIDEMVSYRRPKKPYNIETLHEYEGRTILVGSCPACGKMSTSVDHFCAKCGQNLNWEGGKK